MMKTTTFFSGMVMRERNEAKINLKRIGDSVSSQGKVSQSKMWPQSKDEVKGTMLRSFAENSERFNVMFKDFLRNKQ